MVDLGALEHETNSKRMPAMQARRSDGARRLLLAVLADCDEAPTKGRIIRLYFLLNSPANALCRSAHSLYIAAH